MISQKKFAFAGRATFTVVNEKTSGHHTLKVSRSRGPSVMWFVSIKDGSSFKLVGTIFNGAGRKITLSQKSKWSKNSKTFQIAQWIMDRLDKLPTNVTFHHEGKCCRCGKSLTDPASIELGIGPYCAGLILFG